MMERGLWGGERGGHPCAAEPRLRGNLVGARPSFEMAERCRLRTKPKKAARR